MSKLIPVAGAAKPTPYDRLFYTTLLISIEAGMNDSLGAVKARQLHNNAFHGLSQPEKTAIENVRAKMFIIVNRNDRDVHPQSAIAFAQNKRAQLLELDSDFGHLSFFREFASIAPRVRAFLEQP